MSAPAVHPTYLAPRVNTRLLTLARCRANYRRACDEKRAAGQLYLNACRELGIDEPDALA